VKSKPKVIAPIAEYLLTLTDGQAEQTDKQNLILAKWFFCALSKVGNTLGGI